MDVFWDWFRGNDFLTGGSILMAAGVLLAYLRYIPRFIVSVFRRRFMVSIDVPDHDEAFLWLRLWLSEKTKDRKAGLWSASSNPINSGEQPVAKNNESTHELSFSPAPGLHVVWHNRRPLFILRNRREVETLGHSLRGFVESFTISTFGRQRPMIERILLEGQSLTEKEDNTFTIRRPRYNCWEIMQDAPGRPLESVVLPGNTMAELILDIEQFRSLRAWYNERGIPYRRGYLLYGPPGNGKSSIISAVATHLELDVCVLSLSGSALDDSGVDNLIQDVPNSGILLIEDIDCIFKGRAKDSKRRITLAGFLNSIDGVGASDGRLLFVTTNRKDVLDPALVRAGRLDVQLEIGNATTEQAVKLFSYCYQDSTDEMAERFAERLNSEPISMASLQGFIIKHPNDPSGCLAESTVCTKREPNDA